MAIKDWSTTPSENSNAPPFGAPEGWLPSDANDVIRQLMASVRSQFEEGGWFDYGHDLTRLGGNSFAAQGDRVEVYSLGRKVRVSGTSTGVHYGEVSESAFNGTTTEVTLILYSGSILTDTDFAVAVGVDSNILPQVSGPIVRLISSAQTFSYSNATGTPTLIGPSEILFTINRYNSSSTVTWTVFDALGAEASGALSSVSNLGATLTSAAFAAITENSFIRVRASADGVFDEISIFRLVSGRDGEASNDSLFGFLTNEAHVVPAAPDGSSPVLTGAEGEFKVFEGVTDRSASATYSILSATGCTASINTDVDDPISSQPRGFYRVTAMSADNAVVQMRAVYSDVFIERTFSLAKSLQGVAGNDADLYYIKPMTGTAIKNSTGQITIEARRVTGSSNALLSSGTIRLYDPDNNIVNEANGYGTGSDGYTGVLDPADIDGSIVITLKDGASGTALDTITLIDVSDGLPATIGSVNASNGLVWRRDTSNNWTPSGTTNTVTAEFFRDGVSVAERSLIVTLNTGDGTLTAAEDDDDGEATTYQVIGSGSASLSITFTHTASGVSVQETIATIVSGVAGAPGANGTNGTNGTNGANGVDGISTRMIYIRSVSQPNTPSGTNPLGWYDDIASVPASSDPLWASIGSQATRTDAWVWQVAVRIETIDGEQGDPGYEIVSELPNSGNFIGRVVFLTTTEKLYRFTSSGWTTAVPAADIAGLLTSSQIQSLLSTQIQGQLTTDQIQSIVAGKVTGQIIGTQIADNAISAPKLSANSVTAGSIAANAVTATTIAAGAINADKIAANAVTTDKISANAVTAGKIISGAIQADKIATNAVTAGAIAANAVTADKISAGAVTAAKISVTELSAVSANTGTLTANLIRTAASGNRVEVSNAGTFPLWFGTGTKNAANAKFYVDTSGNVKIEGEILAAQGTFFRARNLVGANVPTTPIVFNTREWSPSQSISASATYYIPRTGGSTNWATIDGASVASPSVGVVQNRTRIILEYTLQFSNGAGGFPELDLIGVYDGGGEVVLRTWNAASLAITNRPRGIVVRTRTSAWTSAQFRFRIRNGTTTGNLSYFQVKATVLNDDPAVQTDDSVDFN
jgi:hypothetical protein